jgi:tRNA threonylcarbamoyladenosine modification (KEOPS) complex  Pcc1 subunit
MMNRPREMKELIIDFESDDVARQILEAIKNRARH